ncbi:MAG: hypothetical protein K9K79_11270 [Desulfohalobiaceae bacterium]|nr:hypothetical protein [Desulfohalobiaceae bacterium]
MDQATQGSISLIDLSEVEVPEHIQETPDGFMLNQGRYFIEKDRCRSYYEILSWALQLTEKTWVGREVIREFIEKASAAAGLERP